MRGLVAAAALVAVLAAGGHPALVAAQCTTSMQGQSLVGQSFANRNMVGCNMQDVSAKGVDFSKANVVGANLQDADLSNTVFKGASATGANFQDATLSGANFQGASMIGANLGGANVGGANFHKANLQGVNLKGIDGAASADWTGANTGIYTTCPDGSKGPCNQLAGSVSSTTSTMASGPMVALIAAAAGAAVGLMAY